MLNRDFNEVTPQRVAEGITIRWVIGQPEGAPTFAMRVIEFGPGAIFAEHQHPYEHEIFVLEGEGVVRVSDDEGPMIPGRVIYVPPGISHSYRNTGQGVLRFICVIPYAESSA
ncbi:MAG: cupin domain-containing protein [Chloroflexi bacterium]|nr:cupin domain-containing protein [Chloroflexota bacterium]